MTKFSIGSPASSINLIDRKEEINSLLDKMRSKSINYNVAVIGYRRVGKTSILLKLCDKLSRDESIVPIYFDIQKNMAEPKIFFARLQKTIFDAYFEKLNKRQKIKARTKIAGDAVGKLLDAIKSKKISGISTEISPEGTITPKIDFGDKKPDYAGVFNSVFGTAKALADKTSIKFVIILDEFQDIGKLDRYEGLKEIFDLFRAVIQDRGDNVSYIISGSRVHMINKMLKSGQSPLFTHFEKMPICGMDKKFSMALFTKYLKAKKIRVKKGIPEKAFEMVGGIPFYLMALAEAWRPGEDIKETYHHSLTDSIGTLKNYIDYVMSEDLASVTGGPILKSILRVLAASDEGLTYSEISHKMDVSLTKLPFYMGNLQNSDLVEKIDKKFLIRDKIVREYLKIEIKELE